MVVVTGESPVLPSYYAMGTFMVLEVFQNWLCLKDLIGQGNSCSQPYCCSCLIDHLSGFHKGLYLLYRNNSCICQLVVKGLGLLLGGKKSLIMGPTFQIQLA
jgi:hypothetical protein